jgi:hypothetical protein
MLVRSSGRALSVQKLAERLVDLLASGATTTTCLASSGFHNKYDRRHLGGAQEQQRPSGASRDGERYRMRPRRCRSLWPVTHTLRRSPWRILGPRVLPCAGPRGRAQCARHSSPVVNRSRCHLVAVVGSGERCQLGRQFCCGSAG